MTCYLCCSHCIVDGEAEGCGMLTGGEYLAAAEAHFGAPVLLPFHHAPSNAWIATTLTNSVMCGVYNC